MESARWLALTDILVSLNNILYPVFKPDPDYCPLLQIYDIQDVSDEAAGEAEFRMILVDGYNLQHAILSQELNNDVKSTLLVIKPGSLVQISKYTLRAGVHHELKRLIKIQKMEVVMANFSPIGRELDYFTWPGEDGMEWADEDWQMENYY